MKIRLLTLFSGYDSQAMAMERLTKDYPPQLIDYELVGWCEIDRNAIIAHNAIFPEAEHLNLGDICKIDPAKVPDCDCITWSFPCFVKGTLVHTSRGYMPIEELRVGDEVLTHKNRYKRVLAWGQRENAPIIKVRGMCFKDIVCTPNHPFYVRKRYHYGHKRERMFTAPEWVSAKELTRDHYIGYAINSKSELPKWDGVDLVYGWHTDRVDRLSPLLSKVEFWYLMGRYVGDGWFREAKTGKRIVIAASSRNIDSLRKCLSALGMNYTETPERTVTKFHICTKEIFAFVQRYGKYANGKCVDEETINLPKHLLKGFVEGYVDSDGCISNNEYKVASVSERLMYGMQQCISKVYCRPARMAWTKRKPTTVIEGRTVNQRDSYTLAWHIDKRKQDKAFYEDGYVWFPVKEVVDLAQFDTVYNIEVEEDNSYTANGAIVHNCQAISNAGKQEGLTEGSGTTSSLAWECMKIFRAKRPKFLLMENVKALIQKKFFPDFLRLQQELEKMGYANFWKVLNAKDYGVPQNRERVFMVSILRDGDSPQFHFPEPFKLDKCVEDYMESAEEVGKSYFLDQNRITRKVLADLLQQPNVREELVKLYNANADTN